MVEYYWILRALRADPLREISKTFQGGERAEAEL